MNRIYWYNFVDRLIAKTMHLIILLALHPFAYAQTVAYPQTTSTSKAAEPNQLSSKSLVQIRKMPFNDELFKLAFQTLVYNSHIQDAYQLALIAVAKRPRDLGWREKLAQTATWAGDYNTGFAQWLYLAKVTNSTKTIQHLSYLAKQLGYNQLLIQSLHMYLAKYPKDVKANIELAYALNRVGKPEVALSILKKLNMRQPNKEAYVLSANIYMDLGQWNNVLITLQQSDKKFGPTIKSLMTQALIYYSRNEFAHAVHVLKIGVPLAKQKDVEFWQTLGDLAWEINDKSMITLSYAHVTNSSNLTRLIDLESIANPKQALHYSLMGWHRFHDVFFLFSLLGLSEQLNHWQNINEILPNLPNKTLKEAENNETFWLAQVGLYRAVGAEDLQRKVLVSGILLHPHMLNLRSSLLWLVITNGESLWVRAIMEDLFQNHMMDDEPIWQVFAEGFAVQNKFYSALTMYQRHLFAHFQNDQVLIDYAAVLERARLYQQAYSLRHYLWARSLAKISHTDQENPKLLLRTLAQMAPFIASGTIQVTLLNDLFVGSTLNEDVNILLNWLVPRKYYALISYLKYYYLNNQLPDWAGINLALLQNDLPTLQEIISHTDRSWPRSDRINAAVRLENKPLAFDLGFQELTERRLANEIYPEFTIYGIELANRFHFGEEYEEFINIIGPRSYVGGKIRLTNSLRILPTLSVWSVKSNQPDFITNVPSTDTVAQVTLEQNIHRGMVFYNIGYRNALNGFVPASLKLSYQLAAKWSGIFSFNFNQENLQDSYMRIGGVQDKIGVNILHNITRRDMVSVELQGLNYYGQDRHYLANGLNLFGWYQHKFWLTYPDYTMGLFANFYGFNRNGTLGGDIKTLFPALPPQDQADPAIVASTNAFEFEQVIPNSYSEGGASISFGDAIQEYSHRWRPYFWGSLYYNTITLLSYNVKGGINGSVFGRDSLLIYGERGVAPSTANSITYRIGARYMIYF